MRKDYHDSKSHYKMYKAGKNWLFAGIGVITLVSTIAMTTPNAHAAELNNDTNLSSTQKDEQKVTSATPAQQAAIDDAQKDVDQDNADITQNQKNTADEQANHDTLTDQTAGKQSDVDQAQADADKANDQVDKDKSAVDNAVPTDYQDKEDAEQQAQNNTDKAQDAVNQATTDKNQAQKDVDNASDKADQAKTAKDDAAKNKTDAQDQADAAKNKVDNTNKATKVHHDATPVKPGTYDKGNVIDSEASLPDTLLDPKDGHTDDVAYYGSSWYVYDSKNDKSKKIDINNLTQNQINELGQYALGLINSLRKQYGLSPMIMSDNTQKMAAGDIAIRNKNGITDDHSRIGNNISQADWNKYTFDSIAGNHDGTKFAAQNLGFFFGTEDTMLAAKVSVLQMLTAMAFDDGPGNYHRQAILMNPNSVDGHNIYSDEEDVTYYFGYGHQYSGNESIFDFWKENNSNVWNGGIAVSTGSDGHSSFASELMKHQKTGYTNNGTDTIETNPAYTNAVNDYNQALAQLTSANKAYNQAKATLKNDQAKAKQLNQDLANAKKAFADNQSSIATSEAKIAQLQDQLKDLQAKLAKDEKNLADAKAAAENNDNSDDTNTGDDDIDNNGSDDTNTSDDDTNTNNSEDTSDTNNNSDSNNHSDDVVPSQSDTKDLNNTVDITENTQNNNVENTAVTNNTKSSPVTQNVSTRLIIRL
ncbi:SEC10/PgrA surface exclusion domain-containing protein [Pediococcus pentosaceus]|uniref:SEC10/PgrA surface exclusion domain-containing protein n=1 Tax=Pediococcus pentosaceus TaxID=1255 RepID=UPI0018E1C953|nr:SEC10/PgrA surface exclusion domain-containing protein [Pediococcus pentosaceus]MBF7103682.1 SEC10/PgrA surface exclusion domain-containing protein [Pediococcus pentosaceus]QQC61688.1 SEC10/PgrA surface exclusion domain-containing protein [Pediococcus pentosaceus]